MRTSLITLMSVVCATLATDRATQAAGPATVGSAWPVAQLVPAGAGDAPVTLDLGSTGEAKLISPLFAGVSMETERVLRSADGSHYLGAGNAPLVALFKQLGVRHLRIGGNTVDDQTKTPDAADVDDLFAFARAAGVNVTYSVRLKHGDPRQSAEIAGHIYNSYKDLLASITIGNEPNQYKKWADYLALTQAHAKAMTEAAPGLALNGPGTHMNPAWLLQYAAAYKGRDRIDYVGTHAYFGGGAYARKAGVAVERDPAPLRAAMLAWHPKYEQFFQQFAPALAEQGLPYRLDETNTYFIGGAPGASNSMAAAVWALDYLYWWAEHGAQGLNFHTGSTLPYPKGSLPNGAVRKPGYYAVFWDAPGGGYAAQAVGYGMKAFDLGGHGSLYPVRAASTDADAHFGAYAVLAEDGSTYLTLLNEEIGTAPRRFTLNQPDAARFAHAESIALGVRSDDAAATEGFTIGGAGIGVDGTWAGKWNAVPTDGAAVTVTLPATSAVVLHLTR